MHDLSRYHRQMILPGVGADGQRRLADSHAAIIGLGALGSAVADLLARAGVGAFTLIDRDVVEPTNLQRQCLYAERDLEAPKAEAAARRLSEINAALRLRPFAADFSPRSAPRLLPFDGADRPHILLDGADNFDARYLTNDLAVRHGVPYIYGGVVASRGMSMPVLPPAGPCLRCLFPEAPPPGSQPTCDTAGVLGPAVATVAARQASDALRVLLGLPVEPALTSFDLWTDDHRRIRAIKDPRCPCCGLRRFDYLEARLGARAVWLCGQNSVQIFPHGAADPDEDAPEILDLPALAERLRPHGAVALTRFMARVSLTGEKADDGGPVHLSVFPDGRALIRGLRNPERARALYDRYVGA